jgi:type II secretory pathway pseudopilin PulG
VEKGSALLETTVAIAIVAMVAGATLAATTFAAGVAGRNAVRTVLQEAAEAELRVALDVLKYQGSTLVPATIATALPMPSGSPLPARLSIGVVDAASGGIAVTVTATAASDTSQQVTLGATLDHRAPLPGAQLHASGLVPAPTGAP